MLQALVVGGYLVSALLYASVLANPTGGLRSGLLSWVSMNRLGLTEFLSVHAATLLGAFVLVSAEGGSDEPHGAIFWVLAAFYAAMAIGAWAFHRSSRALAGFYLLIAVRGVQFFALGEPDADVMRSEVLKNFLMSVPMMLLVAGMSMSDDGLTPWQERFQRDGRTLWGRIKHGRALLFVTGYYALWAFVEYKWPERISNG
jgi:hypothetical protein